MKNIYLIAVIVFFASCLHNKQSEKLPSNKDTNDRQRKTLSVDSIVLIRFEKSDISIHWNNHSSQIVDDSLFKNLKHRYTKERGYLIDQITNVSVTPASACHKDKLALGDIAFLIINEIDGLPFFEVTHVQCDVFDANCPYPEGYFSAIGHDRTGIAKNVRHYLELRHKL